MKPHAASYRADAFVFLGGTIVVLVLTFSLAWVHEDAFITFRVVDNFLAGHGPVFNPGERVQVFTHPLWFFALALLRLTQLPLYYLAILLGLLCTSGTLWLAWRLLRNGASGSIAFPWLALTLSLNTSYLDFSTSGFANSMTHLLLAALIYSEARAPSVSKRILGVALSTAFLALNRMDTILLTAPALVVVVVDGARQIGWKRSLGYSFVALLPFLFWELFALVYFGTPFPNTFFAKTGAYSFGQALAQGMNYMGDYAQAEPLAAIFGIIALSVAFIRRESFSISVALGVLAYLAYLLCIGGDYMRGRFLTAPYFFLVMNAAPWIGEKPAEWLRRRRVGMALLGVILLCVLVQRPSPADRAGKIKINRGREAYGRNLALSRVFHGGIFHKWAVQGRTHGALARRYGPYTTYLPFNLGAGMFGYYAGPSVHCIDPYGLTDAFVSRLPAMANPRPGHFLRHVPEAYLRLRGALPVDSLGKRAVLPAGKALVDYKPRAGEELSPAQYRLYEHVRLLTTGPLWRAERWRAIWMDLVARRRFRKEIIAEWLVAQETVDVAVPYTINEMAIRPDGIRFRGKVMRPDDPIVALWNGIRLPDTLLIDAPTYVWSRKTRTARPDVVKQTGDHALLFTGFEFLLPWPLWIRDHEGEIALGFQADGYVEVFVRIPGIRNQLYEKF